MRVDELYKLWDEYISSWVAGNEWLKKPYFYVLLGQLMHGYYYTANRKSSWRIHLFNFQPSRTGKGQVMKATHFMFHYFNEHSKSKYKSIYMDRSVTPAWLIGGVEERVVRAGKKQRVLVPGALQNYNYIAWGEGESVIKPDNTYGSISSLLRNALDEPGVVSLTARKDIGVDGIIPTYYTNTSICTGSIYNPELASSSIINSGILQRFLITFKTFNAKEMIDLRKKINELEMNSTKWDGRDVRQEFFNEFYNEKYNKEVKFEDGLSEEYSNYREKIEERYMKGFYGLKFETMQAFLTANQLFDKKIAAMITAYEGEKEIGMTELRKAGEVTLPTLKYAKELLFKKFIPGGTKDENKRMKIVIDIVKKGEINQSELMNKLKHLKDRNQWDLGQSNTQHYIEELIDRKILRVRVGAHNSHLLSVS